MKCWRSATIHYTDTRGGRVVRQANWCDQCAPTPQELLAQQQEIKVPSDPLPSMTIAEADALHESVRNALRTHTREVDRLRDHCSKNGRLGEARRLSIVITKLEEARLWLDGNAVL